MEQCSPFGWFYYNEEEGVSELKQFVLQTRMELEATILSAQEEISRKEEEVVHHRDLLISIIKERDEAQSKCQKLLMENLTLQHQLQQRRQQRAADFSRITSSEDKNRVGDSNTSFSSSDTEESIISAPGNTEPINHTQKPFPSQLPPQITLNLAKGRPLPEKGKLLKAVMEAGPLLQTLLLAGPLPQWQHPPPRLDSIDIPPVIIPSSSVDGCLGTKRGIDNFEGYVSSSCCKYQRGISH
ncbi:hypothetical protein Nepgr_009731 [Nepenthes gracilis]|uniref:Uncharacterized protein n=1 Tax=Nepenthes gracilis TaxID=150966 RepID=A0AAD3XKP7_NEPGR|nr:hypothetical protein Nepgr_009731 [Nepenthes gracilis]